MNQYFEILELRPGATPEEVKAAYRDLAKVWHPDRFREDSPRLKAKAAEKLAEINEAYEKIRTYQARQKARRQASEQQGAQDPYDSQAYTGYRPYTPRPGSDTGSSSYSGYSRPVSGEGQPRRRSSTGSFHTSSRPYQQRSSRQQSASRKGSTGTGRHTYRGAGQSSYQGAPSSASAQTLARTTRMMQHNPYAKNYNYLRRRSRRKKKSVKSLLMYLGIVAILALFAVGAMLYINRSNENQPPLLSEWPLRIQAEPGNSSVQAGAGATESSETSDSVYSPQPPVNAYDTPPRLDVVKHAGGPVDAGYFTLGSSKGEVVRTQGEPEQVRRGVFRYGFSSVFFEDDVVVGWHQSPGTELSVQLRPRKAHDLDYFTIGSTRDEVIAVSGTPDHYGDGGRELRYGESRITFQRGRVVSWHINPNSPLNAKLVPKVFSLASFFTLGSTKDEVLSVQGTPDYFSDNSFHYGHSMIHFSDGLVSGWSEATNYPLEVELRPSVPTSTKFFTQGSSRDEVIAAQGTPDQYSERMLKYGYSTVSFEDGRVVSWYQSEASPLNVRSESN